MALQTGGSGQATMGTTGDFSDGGAGLFSPNSTQGFSQSQGSNQGSAPPTGDHPKVAAMKEKMQQRLAQQEADEQSAKQQLADKAQQHLENFYQVRAAPLSEVCLTGEMCGAADGHGVARLHTRLPL